MIKMFHIFSILLFIFLLPGCFKKLPEFEIYGDQDILSHLVINMITYTKNKDNNGQWIRNAKSIMYKGKWNRIYENNDMSETYFYLSYKDRINKLVTDAFFLNQKFKKPHDANIFYAYQKNGEVFVKYYKSRADFANNRNPITINISLTGDIFFKTQKRDEHDIEKELKYYTAYFPPDITAKVTRNYIYEPLLSHAKNQPHLWYYIFSLKMADKSGPQTADIPPC